MDRFVVFWIGLLTVYVGTILLMEVKGQPPELVEKCALYCGGEKEIWDIVGNFGPRLCKCNDMREKWLYGGEE